MAAVPRIFEKVYNRVVTGARPAAAPSDKIFHWAVEVGQVEGRARQPRRTGSPARFAQGAKHKLADKLVFTKLRARLRRPAALLRLRLAPLSREIAEFFDAAGLPILEGYGLTETCAGNLRQPPSEAYRIGTVGMPLPGTEVKHRATTARSCCAGAPIMRGYHNLPEETAEAFDRDGWFHTGDIGEIDADGFLRITDRKKDLIKTSGGKYVAPADRGPVQGDLPVLSRSWCTATTATSARR